MLRPQPTSTLFPYTTLFRSAEQDRIDAAVAGLYACCDDLIADRRENPGNDLISALIDGENLSIDELRILVNTLVFAGDRKSTRLNSSHANISYAVFCLKKKK